MNTTMTPALALPVAPPRPSFVDRLRPHRTQLMLGMTLGLAAELLLDQAPFGLGHALFALLLGGFIASHAGKEAWQSAGQHRGVLIAAVLLLASTMLHDATWLSVMSTMSAIGLFALALQGWTGERSLGSLRTGYLLGAPFLTLGQSVHAGAVVTSRELQDARVTTVAAKHGPAAFRLGLIVVPPALILTALLSSGDAVFRAKLGALEEALFSVPIDGFVRGLFVTGLTGMVFTGALALASRRRQHVDVAAPRRLLKGFEAFALLGTLTTLLFVFGVTSTPCALAPASCTLPPGVNYADAAHEGFFQLLTAALGILVLLMALPARTQLETRRHELTFTALSTGLVLATMPMVVSGVTRLWRYDSVYGLTVLRLLAYAGLFLVAAVLAWRAITLWVAKEHFVAGGIALFTTTLLGLAALSPNRYIAEQNVERTVVDVEYLILLGDEALPALYRAQDRLPELPYRRLGDVLVYRAHRLGASESPLSWNLGRSRTRAALQPLLAVTPENPSPND
jgi:hypothetical protein